MASLRRIGSSGVIIGDAPPLQVGRMGTDKVCKTSELFGESRARVGWVNDNNKVIVSAVQQGDQGNLKLEFLDGHSISIFPAGAEREAWVFFTRR